MDAQLVQAAVERLVAVANPRRIILFGSHARGDAGQDSDLDFLVVFGELASRRQQAVRLREALRPLRVPVDILVVTEAQLQEWGHLPGTVLFEASHEGKIVCEVA